MVRNVGWMAAEFARLPRYTRENIEEAMILDGFENFAAAKRRGKGVLFLTGHMGAWELEALAHALYSEPIHFLVRPIDNPRVDALVNRYRGLSGNRPINKNESARTVLRILRGGGVIGVLADQNAVPAESVFVDFFGIPAATTSGIARLARRTGAAVVPVYSYWDHAACASTACVMSRRSSSLPQTTSRTISGTIRRGSIRRSKIMCGASQINGSGYIGAGRPALRTNPPYTRTSSTIMPGKRKPIKSLPRRRSVMMANRTAGDLAKFLGCALQGQADLNLKGVASPEAAEADDLVYLDSIRHLERVIRSAARCVITSPDLPVPGKDPDSRCSAENGLREGRRLADSGIADCHAECIRRP